MLRVAKDVLVGGSKTYQIEVVGDEGEEKNRVRQFHVKSDEELLDFICNHLAEI